MASLQTSTTLARYVGGIVAPTIGHRRHVIDVRLVTHGWPVTPAWDSQWTVDQMRHAHVCFFMSAYSLAITVCDGYWTIGLGMDIIGL